jgi:hypothetical protein
MAVIFYLLLPISFGIFLIAYSFWHTLILHQGIVIGVGRVDLNFSSQTSLSAEPAPTERSLINRM